MSVTTLPPRGQALRQPGWLAQVFDYKPFLIVMCLAPAIGLLLVFLTYPLGLGIWLAFTDTTIGQRGIYIGLENFQYLLKDPLWWNAVFYSIFYTAVATFGKFALGFWLALLLNNHFPFKSLIRAIGRLSVFYNASAWNGTSDLALTHLGDTEGEITIEHNEEYSDMTADEVAGPAILERWFKGEAPVVTVPMWFGPTALLDLISPLGSGSGGRDRWRRVQGRTIVLLPERLMYDESTQEYKTLAFTGSPGSWTVGGGALTAEQTRYLAHSMWFWNAHFHRPNIPGNAQDAGKAVGSVDITVMRSDIAALPDGHRQFTRGDPAAAGIDIEPVTAP